MLPVPPTDRVDLWIVRLAEADVVEARFVARGERAQAARIRVPARRRHFLFRRAVRRHVLGRYLPIWRIEHGPAGKPRVAGAPLGFGASGAQWLCAVAVAAGEVGVDIVAAEGAVDLAELCARYVPGGGAPDDVPEACRRAAAMRRWARFEAGIKLDGGALFDALANADARPAAHADLVVATRDFACAVARPVPFRLARLEILPFAEIAHAG